MIDSSLYLMASTSDIIFSAYFCGRFHSCPKESHLIMVKCIIRYLKGTIRMGMWYQKIGQFSITSFLDADYAGYIVDKKSTSGTCQFFRKLSCFVIFQETKFRGHLNRRGRVCCTWGLLCTSSLDETYSLWLWFASY